MLGGVAGVRSNAAPMLMPLLSDFPSALSPVKAILQVR
jgi:hypothetical protein